MADRFALIARKQEVRRRLEALQRQLDHERTKSPLLPRRIQQLEQQVDRLMAEEYQLRVAIDQAGR